MTFCKKKTYAKNAIRADVFAGETLDPFNPNIFQIMPNVLESLKLS